MQSPIERISHPRCPDRNPSRMPRTLITLQKGDPLESSSIQQYNYPSNQMIPSTDYSR